MLIEDAKVKELVYSGNTVIFLLPNRECMRENSFFWSPSQRSNQHPIKLGTRLVLKINKTKYFASLVTLATKSKPMKIMLDATKLQHTDSATYLGITFDKRHTWKTHIRRAEAKTRRKLALLRKLAGTQWGATETVLNNVYIGTVRSHQEYGSTTLSSASNSAIYTLEKVQNQALQLITGSMKSTPIRVMEETTAIQPLSKIRDMRNIQAERYTCPPSHPMRKRADAMTKHRIKREASFIRTTT